MHLAVRGLYGEGTEASGDFFQVSNQTTLGCSERQIVTDFRERILPAFIDYEKRARASLLAKNRLAVEDKVARALAILRSARLISSEETMYLLSLVRFGINEGLVENVIDLRTMNELFLLCQPAHLQRVLGQEMPPQDRSQARAEYIRKRLTR
jgi:protein arginine kinase